LENYAKNGGLGCPNCHHPIGSHSSNTTDCAMDIECVSQIETNEMTQSSQTRRLKQRQKN